jgi:hypothetical protein
MKKSVAQLFAFGFFMLGFLSLLLSTLGLEFKFLRWMSSWPGYTDELFQLFLMVLGLIWIYILKTDNTRLPP